MRKIQSLSLIPVLLSLTAAHGADAGHRRPSTRVERPGQAIRMDGADAQYFTQVMEALDLKPTRDDAKMRQYDVALVTCFAPSGYGCSFFQGRYGQSTDHQADVEQMDLALKGLTPNPKPGAEYAFAFEKVRCTFRKGPEFLDRFVCTMKQLDLSQMRD